MGPSRMNRDRLEIAASGKTQERDYWLKKLRGIPIETGFPPDYEKSKVAGNRIKTLDYRLPAELFATLRELSKGSDYTLNAILAAGLVLLLNKYTASRDIIIAAPIYKQEIATEFINTLLVLRNPVAKNMTFKHLLLQVGQTIREATENYSYPLELLLEQLGIPVAETGPPSIAAALLLENIHDREYLRHMNFGMTFTFLRKENTLAGKLEYDSLLYRQDTVARIAAHYIHLLEMALPDLDLEISAVNLLSRDEKKHILDDFNDTARPLNHLENKLVHRVFEAQAARTPHRTALVGASIGTGGLHCTSYRELNRQSGRLARLLRLKGIEAGNIVSLMVERSLEMVVGILGILQAGAAYLPLAPVSPPERTGYMITDSGANLLVTTRTLAIEVEKLGRWEGEKIFLEKVPDITKSSACPLTLIPSTYPMSSAVKNLLPATGHRQLATTLAYIIYTSGSTGKPKAVAVEHPSLINLLFALANAYPFLETDSYLLKTSFIFDVSAAELFGWFFGGGKLAVLAKDAEKNTHKILDSIERYQISHINFVPSQFRVFVTSLQREQCRKLDPLKYIFLAGEALLAEVAGQFRRLNTGIPLENLYGPTEATIYASRYSLRDWDGVAPIPIGKPLPNIKLYIFDLEGDLQPIGVPGELAISGACLARGYLNNPELTNDKFKIKNGSGALRADLNARGDVSDDHSPFTTHHSPIYHTGDLGKWLPDGNIEFLGRRDQQVKIRGFRIELGEIENRLLSHDEIKEAVVTVVTQEKKPQEPLLCAYIVSAQKFKTSYLREYLTHKLPDYMVPSFFEEVEEIPLTPGGKVDRRRLPAPKFRKGMEYHPPRDEVENLLVDIWSEVLGVDKSSLGIDDPFLDLGGHSLKANLMAAKIHKTFDVQLPLTAIFTSSTPREMAAYIKRTVKDRYIPIEPVEKKEYYLSSSAQGRLYILQQMDEQGIGYNMPSLWDLEGDIDKVRLEEAFRGLIRRHESVRTSFHLVKEEPVQQIHEQVEFQVENYQLPAPNYKQIPNLITNFIHPFDLSKAPLLRVGLIELTGGGTGTGNRHGHAVLMVDMHHIIADGTSMNIVVKDFMALYNQRDLPALRNQYKDFSGWWHREAQAISIKQQEDYWLKEFAGEIPVLDLAIDYTRPLVQRFEGKTVTFAIGEEDTRALKQYALEKGATLFMVLLTIIDVLLYKLSGQEDIVIGSPIAGRRHSDLEPIIGMFVNTLPLRTIIPGEQSYSTFLEQVKSKTLEAYENQEYPFEKLVEILDVNRDSGRNPLFDVLLVLQNMESSPAFQLPGLKITPYPYEHKIAKFDLHFNGLEIDEKLSISLEYNNHLFDRQTILRMVKYFKQVVVCVLENPRVILEEIELLGDKEKEEILRWSQGIREAIEVDDAIHRLFEQKADRLKNEVALVFRGQNLTYDELNRQSNRLAKGLREIGVGPDTIVGLMVERSAAMVVGIVGIMKAGGAYLPIDSDYPEARKKYLLLDSQVSLLLMDFENKGLTDFIPDNVKILTLGNEGLYAPGDENPEHGVTGSNLVYLIYTSGSTGEPKGIMMEHRNLANLIAYQFSQTNITFKRVLQFTTISFDVSFQEIFSTLLAGGKLYLVDKETRDNIPGLFEVIDKNKIETLFLPASFLKFIMKEKEYIDRMPTGIRHIVTAGEQVIVAAGFRNYLKKHRVWLHNHYGPAETHVVTMLSLDPHNEIPEMPSIGKPIANTGIYILDKGKRIQPIGVLGELFIGGIQVSRGYWNRENLTTERFLKNPFAPGERMYKTGDLGRWLPDGNIEFSGRIDTQVKIRGFRIELGEVENQLLRHNEIKEAVVVSREEKQGDQLYLCGYFVSDSNISKAVLREYLLKTLPDYMIPSYFLRVEKIPLTPNGKIDKRALPEPAIMAGDDYVAPRNQVEEKLVEIWSGILGIEKDSISIDANFFHLGGHSLKATLMAAKIHKAFHVNVPLAQIFVNATIRALAAVIDEAAENRYLPLEPAEKKEYYTPSSAQKRLYVLQQMDEQGLAYNIPSLWLLEGDIVGSQLENTLLTLIRRHEALRTSFPIVNDEPVQKIHDEVEFEIEYDESGDRQEAIGNKEEPMPGPLMKDFLRPFDISKAPLLRAGIVKRDKGTYFFMMDLHHIISDGISLNVLIKEFITLSGGDRPPALRVQYKDFSRWQKSKPYREKIKPQKEYWQKKFEEEITVLNLPTDYVRPMARDFEGSALGFELDKEDTRQLRTLASEQGTTLFMILLSIYTIFLAKLGGQEDIIVGTPIAGRRHVDLGLIMGMFVNTLALRNFPSGRKEVIRFFKEVRDRGLHAFENQDYPYEELVEQVEVGRNTDRNPLFDTMFTLHHEDTRLRDMEIRGMHLKLYPFETSVSKFDLSLFGIETGEKLIFSIEYSTKLFKEETVKRLANYFKTLVAGIAAKLPGRIKDLDILPAEEKRIILAEFNETGSPFPPAKTIIDGFEAAVQRIPANTALNDEDQQITYGVLNETVNRLGHGLKDKGTGADAVVSIMAERSIETVAAILGILKAGAAYLPIEPLHPRERIKYMMEESRTHLLLSCTAIPSSLNGYCELLDLKDPDWWSSETGNPERINTPHDLAYATYTSGSTGKPKGVLVEHRSLVNILGFLQGKYPLGEKDNYLFKTSMVFDVSLTELFGWFSGGGRLTILESGGEKDPRVILDTTARSQVTHINFVPSMFNVFVQLLTPQDMNRLSGLKYIFLAGEALWPELVVKAGCLPPQVAVENLYGPTEAAIYASGYSLQQWDGRGNIPIGRPLGNVKLYILDKYHHIQPLGIPGELMISGAGIARGYLNNPELTAERFLLIINRSDKSYISKKLYKSGDLARWQPGGDIEFLGRMDHQVKIRGFRIELGEIENRLLSHEKIKEAVVIAKHDGERNRVLCAYLVPVRTFDVSELRTYLTASLPDYMIPSYFLPLEKIPLTASGKIDRGALPDPVISAKEDYIGPGNPLELKLVEIWSEVLGVKKAAISLGSNFFELGGHSLRATIVISKIHKAMNVKVPLGEIFKTPTIRGLSGYIRKAEENRCESPEPVEKRDYYALSSAQRRLYLIQQFEPGSLGYNMPQVLQMTSLPEIDGKRLEETLRQLVARHESFRTSFETAADKPVQRIHDEVPFSLEYWEINQTDTARLLQDFTRPFDLSQAPLLRAGLAIIESSPPILLVDMHHIITDGTSQDLLREEFMALYPGGPLASPPLRLQYKDYSRWHNSEGQQLAMKQQEAYWLEVFGDEPPVLNLPTDYPRPLVQSFQGGLVSFLLTETETRTIKGLARETDSTPYMTLLAVFNILLSRLGGQEDIVVGTPTAGRRHADLSRIIGMFVNTLALRNFPSGQKRVIEFFKEVRDRSLEAFENQDYQFEDLVERVSTHRDTSRNPIFSVMFNLMNQQEYKGEIPLTAGRDSYDHKESTSKFDMNWTVLDMGKQFYVSLEYCGRLFKTDTSERFITYFRKILHLLAENETRERKLSGIVLITDAEMRQILYEFNDTEVDYPHDKTIHELFAQQVEKRPDQPALVFNCHYLTYRQLNHAANHLAGNLRGKGVCPDTIVGLMVERSCEMILGILALLKAGGAYLPIDSDYPSERKKYMLADSGVKLLLVNCDRTDAAGYVPEGIDILDIRPEATNTAGRGDSRNPRHISKSSDLLYLIYTSGSTGMPKGVMLEHKNLVNLISYQYEYTNLDFTRVLQFTTISFDVASQEIFSTLLWGGTLYLIDEGKRLEIPLLFELIARNLIGTVFFPPAFLKSVFSEEDDVSAFPGIVKHIVTAGEQLIVLQGFRRYLKENNVYLHNHYGPSETHVVTALTLDAAGDLPKLPPIGQPISNTAIYILGQYRELLPPGTAGELHIGGAQLGRGYVGHAELTREKFIAHPFKKGERLYKTGDLARWLPEGNIEFLGRIDYQVKIRGYRVELGEIESQLLKYGEIKDAVVLAGETAAEKYLSAYIVTGKGFTLTGLRTHLSAKLPSYMIPSYVVQLEKIPLTPSGKVDRRRLPEGNLIPGHDYTAPRNRTEQLLVEIWAETLGLEEGKIGIDADFFQLGGHSLNAMIITAKIYKALNVNIPLAAMFNLPTIRGLAEDLKNAKIDKYPPLKKVENRDYYPLSSAQQRLYILQQMLPNNTVYNISGVLILEGEIQPRRFENVFKQLIQRHESFRTSFLIVNEKPVQKIFAEVVFEIKYNDKKGEEVIEIIRDVVKPFDLTRAPLLRVAIAKIDEKKHLLILDMHHIIMDGISLSVFTREFMALYAGRTLPPINMTYKDYSQWQNRLDTSRALKRQEEFWIKTFGEEIPLLSIPSDYPRPSVLNFTGRSFHFESGREQTEKLRIFNLESQTTPYMAWLAVYNVLLAKLSGQEDIIVGSPIAGRRYQEFENLLGLFVNILAMRNYPSGGKAFSTFLAEVKDRTLNAFENQDYQFESLVEKIVKNRDFSRNPVFDAVFLMQNMDTQEVELPDLKMKYHPHEKWESRFDMSFICQNDRDHWAFNIEYSSALFKETTIARFVNYFKRILDVVVENPGIKISRIEVISAEEKKRVLFDFNDTEAAYSRHKTVHRLFEEQVLRTPENTAVITGGRKISYKELNEQSNRLALELREIRLEERPFVAVILDRSIEMVVSVMGILKSGGAYVPIEPALPDARIGRILSTVNPGAILTHGNQLTRLVELTGECPHLEKIICMASAAKDRETPVFPANKRLVFAGEGPGKPGDNPVPRATPESAAYVIFTSGSTGTPKGVMEKHKPVINIIEWMNKTFQVNASDRLLFVTSLSFDLSVYDIFGILAAGATIRLVTGQELKEPKQLLDIIFTEGITIWDSAPAALQQLVPFFPEGDRHTYEYDSRLRWVFLSGDWIPVSLPDVLRNTFKGVKVISLGGATEATIWSNYYPIGKVEPSWPSIPYGKPVQNAKYYILDPYLNPCLIGVAGDLYIGGQCLASGYINDKELTDSKFIPNPFVPGEIIYRTGDLARWFEDGNMEFLGRKDHQVKIRGYRIELGEIESQLLRCDGVKDTVVIAREDNQGQKILAAYVVPDRNQAPRLHKILEMENRGLLPLGSRCTLPNGMSVAYLNREETDFMYKKIIREKSYFKHGIKLNKGACVFDVGANIGIFSILVNQLFPDARIYAFEPIPAISDRLSLNASIYDINIEICRHGLSDRNGEETFTFYPRASILSGRFADIREEMKAIKTFLENENTTRDNAAGLSGEQITEMLMDRLTATLIQCQVKTLAQVIETYGIRRIDLLKIDVEKSEISVLDGIAAADWGIIDQLVIEVHDTDGELEKILAMLDKYGFEAVVEQDAVLDQTRFYEVYALRKKNKASFEDSGNLEADFRYTSPERFIDDLRQSLQGNLPVYMIPSSIQLLGALPLTSNGKVDRNALPAPHLNLENIQTAPETELEGKLMEIAAEILGIAREKIGTHHNFFELGGDSIKIALFSSKIKKNLQAEIPLAEMFKHPTIKAIAEHIRSEDRHLFIPIKKAPAMDYYPSTSQQKSLYFLQQLDLNSTAYNIPLAIFIEGDLDRDKLEKTINKLIERHEPLRTRFLYYGRELVQKIEPDLDFTLEYDCDAQTGSEPLLNVFTRPFDLSRAPLMRVKLIKRHNFQHLLLFDIHHIIFDDISMGIFQREFVQLYADQPLPGLNYQFKDYSTWYKEEFEIKTMKKQEEYWKSRLGGQLPNFDLPLDFPRPRKPLFEGKREFIPVDTELSERIRTFAKQERVTLFMMFLTAWNTLLAKYTGEEDIIVGSPIDGRTRSDFENTIGMFVNTLAMRNFPAGHKTFAAFLQEIKENSLLAFENQEYPFELLVSQLNIKPDPGKTPLFDTLLGFASMDSPAGINLENLRFVPYNLEQNSSKFDIAIRIIKKDTDLLLQVEYKTSLYRRESIEHIINDLLLILDQVCAKPGILLQDIKIHGETVNIKLREEIAEAEMSFDF